jgi:hypothetical protein
MKTLLRFVLPALLSIPAIRGPAQAQIGMPMDVCNSGTVPAADQVIAYADINYLGACRLLTLGTYPTPTSFGLPDNSISSVKVGTNAQVQLFWDANFAIPNTTFGFLDGATRIGGNAPDLRMFQNPAGSFQGWSDVTSSIRVIRKSDACGPPGAGQVVLFQHANYQGDCVTKSPGWFDVWDIGLMNDSISSLKVGPSARVTICQNANQGGRCDEYRADQPSLDGTPVGNDSVSSMRVDGATVPILTLVAPAIASRGPNKLDVFMVGTDKQLWHRGFDNGWAGGWDPVGGAFTTAPAAVASSANRVDVFAVDASGTLKHGWSDGTWHLWETIGSGVTSAPAAASWAPGRLDVFVRDASNGIVHWVTTGGPWSSEPLGGSFTSAPAAVSWGTNRIDVFARLGDNTMGDGAWNGSFWDVWYTLGGAFLYGPGVSAGVANRLDLFGIGTDNGMWHRAWNGSTWDGWAPIGGQFFSGPAAVSWGSNRIDMVARGGDNSVWHGWWANGWHLWESLGHP